MKELSELVAFLAPGRTPILRLGYFLFLIFPLYVICLPLALIVHFLLIADNAK